MNATDVAARSSRRVVAAVVLLALVAAFGFPMLDRGLNPGATTPSVISFVGVGLSVLALTLVLLFAGLRDVLPRSGVFLGAMLGYNALLVLVKFGLGPLALYVQSENNGLFVLASSQGNFLYVIAFLALAAVTALLYSLAFFLLYLYFRSSLRRRLGINPRIESGFTGLLIAMFAIGAVGAVSLIGLYGLLEYLVAFLVFPVLAALLALALLAALVLCGVAFREANEQAVLIRDVTLLSSFAWIGLAFIAAYHILWLVFILTLVALFPLKAMNVK